ncbi:hypothetical protein M404DRAFT_135404 [Pisolithus tinctorius Marx 270]|uniref:Retroviral polymerase SH3-like domain-containing protein n=1 Tax=Pisolithus tinctorius Marx 270 TaxID=870435 RepID=A0A0C3PHY5_PISTI|nr:hypothetical protein M404DRAFT_135404 [Pisolithus tinctorius Marx 270]
MHMNWLKNQTSTHALDKKTPYEMLYKKKPDLSNLLIWGCHIKVHTDDGSKLDMCMKDGRWVGFDKDTNAHRIYFEDSQCVGVEQNVRFSSQEVTIPIGMQLEGEKYITDDEGESSTLHIAESAPTTPSTPIDHLGPRFEPAAPTHCSGHTHCESKSYVWCLHEGEGTYDGRIQLPTLPLPRGIQPGSQQEENRETANLGMMGVMDEDDEEVFTLVAGMVELEGTDPITIEDAHARPDWSKWEEAINKELTLLDKAQTWSIVERPHSVNVVGCKWVFCIKQNMEGEIEKYKV